MRRLCLCIAHRGASGYEPENSLGSFNRAIELGAPWVEFDVRVVEETPIVFHDRTLTRMTHSHGIVEKQTLASIRALSLPNGEKIPLLREVLDALRAKACAQIELKGPGSGEATASTLRQALQEGWSPTCFIVSSFDQQELASFAALAPEIPLGLLTYGYPLNCVEIARKLKAVSVHLHLDAVSHGRIKELHDAGFKVFVYTVNDPNDITTVLELGVDGIFSDFPDRVLQVLRS